MDAPKLRAALEPWIRVDTWNTSHPFDEKRFHEALRAAFTALGPSIGKRDFEEAIIALVEKYHAEIPPSYRREDVHYWATRAECIASYVQDVGDSNTLSRIGSSPDTTTATIHDISKRH